MPEVSRLFGIVISMFYNDHPPPHFHARYGGHKALVAIDSLTLPRRPSTTGPRAGGRMGNEASGRALGELESRA